ncbi:hypothetical protein K439DRAFT_857966 [Ramaria rubella]|nr:hypothetical protein K439DRAFT_857966 [Ramaria rubella]
MLSLELITFSSSFERCYDWLEIKGSPLKDSEETNHDGIKTKCIRLQKTEYRSSNSLEATNNHETSRTHIAGPSGSTTHPYYYYYYYILVVLWGTGRLWIHRSL